MLFDKGGTNDKERLNTTEPLLLKIANLEQVRWLDTGETAPFSSTARTGDLEVMIPLAGLIDIEEEIQRLSKQIEKLAGDSSRLEGKLNNQRFVDNAPPEVVAAERKKLTDNQQTLELLQSKLEEVKNLG